MTPDTDPRQPQGVVPDRAPRRRRRWPAIVGSIVLGVVVVTVAAMAFIHVPYVIISPGDATALNGQVVTIEGAPTYPHRGQLLYLTVRVSNDDPNIWRYLFAKLDDDVSVQKREAVIGCASYDESGRLNQDLMVQSQNTAKQVALERLGYQVTQNGARVVIVNVECGGPADGHLQLDDVVTAVDGMPIAKAEDVRPLVLAHKPGETIHFTVQRAGATRQVSVRLGADDGAALVGIATQTFTDSSFPVDISIDTARVSGPSAGLAFTLAIIDDMTQGDLTGGGRVAITGSIESDGTVGVVGGVEQKAVTARRQGARLMLVPVGEEKAAREHADGMRVVAVRNVDDALAALAAHGGDPVPPATVPPTTEPPTGQ
jgi:PDZ domain-containing protein